MTGNKGRSDDHSGVFFGREVLYVTVLSIVALVPNFASETPVETEEE